MLGSLTWKNKKHVSGPNFPLYSHQLGGQHEEQKEWEYKTCVPL